MAAVAFDHVHLISQDPEAAAEWYVSHLGGVVASVQQDLRGAIQIAVKFEQGMALLLRGARPGESPVPTGTLQPFEGHADGVFVSHNEWGIDHFCFRVVGEDLDSFCDRLREQGVSFGTAEAGRPGPYAFKPNARIAYLCGPDNVSIELVQGSLQPAQTTSSPPSSSTQVQPRVAAEGKMLVPAGMRVFGSKRIRYISSYRQSDPDPVPAAELREALQVQLDNGITEYDTARSYGREHVLGAALRELPPAVAARLLISTKASPLSGGGFSHSQMFEQAAISRAELGRDAVYVLYLHSPDTDTDLDETLAAMNELWLAQEQDQQGFCAEWGVSNFPAWQVMQIYMKCKMYGYPLPTV